MAQEADAASPLPAAAIVLEVDATDIDHRLFHVQERVPVRPGALVLQYPQWVPGTHGPVGSVARLAGLQMRSGGRPLAWTRDSAAVDSFRVLVPAGASELELEFDHLSSTHDTEDNEVMHDLLAVNWRNLLLYPAGAAAAQVPVQAAVTLPAAWDVATALRPATTEANAAGAPNRHAYPATSLETLIDSPLYSAPRMRHLVLDPDPSHPVTLHVLANEDAQLAVPDDQRLAYVRLVRQAEALFGARHYQHYDFIVVVDDLFGFHGGLEHHQSSENGVKRGYFIDGERALPGRALLPHEFTHSWNGKFRRPLDLWTPGYNTPMGDSLLWVYEGLTNYWGQVLAARCGLVSPEAARANLAWQAGGAQQRAGRAWRSLQDTTNEPVAGRTVRRKDWPDWQRGADYYDEGSLLWLAVDVKLRELSRDRHSLDDFARVFFGSDDGRIAPQLYGFDDIVSALDGVAHYDWTGFLRQRLDAHDSTGLQDGIEGAGWRLTYGDKPSVYARAVDEAGDTVSLLDSLGIVLAKDGTLTRVAWHGPAFNAGLAPGNVVVAVNEHSYRPDLMRQAVTAAKSAPDPIVLLVKDGDLYRSVAIGYHGGLRYPQLERANGTRDLLAEILAPR